MFIDTHDNALDAKGRVSAPAGFRSVAAGEGLDGVYLWRSFDGPFLEGGGARHLERLQAAIEAMDHYDERRAAFEMVIFGGAKLLSFDSTGRITLPKPFIDHAGLNNRAVFVGRGQRFEVHNPDHHAETFSAALDKARADKAALRNSPSHAAGGGA